MSEHTKTIMVDTNVWVDLYVPGRPLRDQHAEIEDNLIVAACMRIKADYLVTNDEKLLRHAPVAAVTPRQMVRLLEVVG